MPPVAGATGCRATCRQGCLSYSGSRTTDVRSPDANTSAARLGRMRRHLSTRMRALLSCWRDQPVTSYQNRALAAQSRFLTLQPSSGFGEEKPQTEKPGLRYISYRRAAGSSTGSAQQYQGSVRYGTAARERRGGMLGNSSGGGCSCARSQMPEKIFCRDRPRHSASLMNRRSCR